MVMVIDELFFSGWLLSTFFWFLAFGCDDLREISTSWVCCLREDSGVGGVRDDVHGLRSFFRPLDSTSTNPSTLTHDHRPRPVPFRAFLLFEPRGSSGCANICTSMGLFGGRGRCALSFLALGEDGFVPATFVLSVLEQRWVLLGVLGILRVQKSVSVSCWQRFGERDRVAEVGARPGSAWAWTTGRGLFVSGVAFRDRVRMGIEGVGSENLCRTFVP